MVSQGEIVLQTLQGELVFPFSWLPAGASVLVPEQNACPFVPNETIAVRGYGCGIYPENCGAVTVEAIGPGNITVRNHTTQPIPQTQVVLRSCDPESGIYIGGDAVCLFIDDLQSGELRQLPAELQDHTEVVCILPMSEKIT